MLPECLVFDSKLTTYQNLNRLDKDFGIKFITLKRRGKKILENVSKISNWTKVRLNKTTRKHKVQKYISILFQSKITMAS